jgi:hypothetical protein
VPIGGDEQKQKSPEMMFSSTRCPVHGAKTGREPGAAYGGTPLRRVAAAAKSTENAEVVIE